MRETTLATLDDDAIGEAFTAAYENYLLPFVVDGRWAARHVALNDIVPEASPLWLDDAGRMVGLTALGRRGARGWVGGFGIALEHRGRGLAARLMAALLDSARRVGLERVQLEVLVENERAIRTYERAGFAITRDLRFFARDPAAGAAMGVAEVAMLAPADPATLLAHAAHLRPVSQAWQREAGAIARTPGLAGAVLGPADDPEAYVIYGGNATSATILDFAAPDIESALALAAALPAHLPGRTLRLSNEPEESPVCVALDQLGWPETLRQHEMVVAL